MIELAKALVAAQAEMPAVSKDSSNPHFKSKFASLDNIIAETRPVLNRHGLSLHQFPSLNDLGQPTLITRISHVSGESLEYAAPLFLQGQDMQKYGAALTYQRRYSWAAALGIANDEDDDGNTASAPARETTAPASNGQPPKITTAQGARLWAIAKAKNVDKEAVREMMKRIASVESTKDIPLDKYDKLVAAVEVGNSSFYAPTGGGQGDDIPFEPSI